MNILMNPARVLRGALAFAVSALMLLGQSFTGAAPTVDAASAPRLPAVMWGVYHAPAPYTMLPIYNLENALNAGGPVVTGVSLIEYGHSWSNGTDSAGNPTSYNNFAWNYMNHIWAHGSYPVVGWQSWSPSSQSTYAPNTPEWRTSEITAGRYDSYIRKFADDSKAWGHPFFLRFDHEQNGPWRFPWGDLVNGNHHGDYIAMWRHVHDIFTAEHVTNVTWVWNPNIHSTNSEPMANTFPGAAYVDWLGLDGYNWGSDAGNSWQTFSQVFSASHNTGYGSVNSYAEITALAPGKPVMLNEVATSINGGPNGAASAGVWITDMLTEQLPKLPMIRAFVYMDDDYDGNDAIQSKSITWPIMDSAAGLAAFKAGIKNPIYSHNQMGSWTSAVAPIQPTTYQP